MPCGQYSEVHPQLNCTTHFNVTIRRTCAVAQNVSIAPSSIVWWSTLCAAKGSCRPDPAASVSDALYTEQGPAATLPFFAALQSCCNACRLLRLNCTKRHLDDYLAQAIADEAQAQAKLEADVKAVEAEEKKAVDQAVFQVLCSRCCEWSSHASAVGVAAWHALGEDWGRGGGGGGSCPVLTRFRILNASLAPTVAN